MIRHLLHNSCWHCMSFMWQAWDIEAHLIHPDKDKGVDTLRVYARVGPKQIKPCAHLRTTCMYQH